MGAATPQLGRPKSAPKAALATEHFTFSSRSMGTLGLLCISAPALSLPMFSPQVWDLGAFFDSGGMPSSHSSLCSSVTTAIAMQQGLGSPLFSVAVCFRCGLAACCWCGRATVAGCCGRLLSASCAGRLLRAGDSRMPCRHSARWLDGGCHSFSGRQPSLGPIRCDAPCGSRALPPNACAGPTDLLTVLFIPASLCCSVIVMYDAMGIRRHAGLQAQVCAAPLLEPCCCS